MKGKLKKVFSKRNITVAIVLVILAVLSGVSVKEYYGNSAGLQTELNNSQNTAKGKVTITATLNNGTKKTKSVYLNNPIKNTTDGNFKISGKTVLQQAATHLGESYSTGGNDCSQFVWNAFQYTKINGVEGFWDLDSNGATNKDIFPNQTMEWLINSSDAAWDELMFWKCDSSDNYNIKDVYYDGKSGNGNSIYDSASKLKVCWNDNGTLGSTGINVLKVNDPIISGSLEWYEYYDGTTKKDLPMGTIVVSYGSQWTSKTWDTKKQNHMWICIGNLGVSDVDSAAKILYDTGIISLAQYNNRANLFKDEGDSTYWMIDNSGSLGVKIRNYKPEMSYSGDGTGKVIGPIWAFQVANDYTIKYPLTLNIYKVDKDTGKVNLASYAGFDYQVTDSQTAYLSSIFMSPLSLDSSKSYFSTTINIGVGETKYLWIRETKMTNDDYTMGEFEDANTYLCYKIVANSKTNFTVTPIGNNGWVSHSGTVTTTKAKTDTLQNYSPWSGTSGSSIGGTFTITVKDPTDEPDYTVGNYEVKLKKIDKDTGEVLNANFNYSKLYTDVDYTWRGNVPTDGYTKNTNFSYASFGSTPATYDSTDSSENYDYGDIYLFTENSVKNANEDTVYQKDEHVYCLVVLKDAYPTYTDPTGEKTIYGRMGQVTLFELNLAGETFTMSADEAASAIVNRRSKL